MNTILIIVGIVVLICLLVHFWRTHKEPKLNDVALITGGVKCGKTSMSLYLAHRQYKKNLFKWNIKTYLATKFNKPYTEKPLFYTNIPVSFPHVLVSKELLLRQTRPTFKSVCFLDEASLIADSFDFKDEKVNENIKLFNKLWGHMTHGGTLVYNTQSESDLHFNIKRCVGSYIWIHHTYKRIPFFLVFLCREMYMGGDGNVINAVNEDIEDSLKWVICSKRIWKHFDCYCYSHYTDAKKTDTHIVQGSQTLKADVVSFKKYSTLLEENLNENN